MAITTPIIRPVKPTFNAGSGLRSPLDKDDLTNAHKKAVTPNMSTFNLATQVQQHTVLLNKLRRRIMTPPLTPTALYNLTAFSIYAIGQGFQIRDGIIGFRSIYDIYTLPDDTTFFPGCGAYEYPLYCPNTDGTAYTVPQADTADQYYGVNFGRQPLVNATQKTLDATGLVTTIDAGDLIIIPSTNDFSPGSCLAVFWIEITDDPDDGLSVSLKGQLVGDTVFTHAPPPIHRATIFPVGENVFPIGWVEFPSGNIQQYQVGNLVNRYLPYTLGSSSPLNLRGTWIADSLSGQAFYNGDVVLDDSKTYPYPTSPVYGSTTDSSFVSFPSSAIQWINAYVYINGSGIETADPNTNLANWKKIYSMLT